MADEASGNGAEPQGRSELERFESLLKKLLEVPKAEVDALRKPREAPAPGALVPGRSRTSGGK